MKKWIGVLVMLLMMGLVTGLCQEESDLAAQLPLKLGDSSEVIRDVREAFFEIGLYMQQMIGEDELFSAEYDEQLQRAVCEYQKMQGLEETGLIDAATMDRLLPRYFERIDAATKGALVLGTISDEVKTMQENLAVLGFYSGDVTGHIGSKTEGAIMAFQAVHGLTANGFADEDTLNAIAQAVNRMN